MGIHTYNCPNCASAVMFDSVAQMMKCPSCGAGFDAAAFESAVVEGRKEDADKPTDDYFDLSELERHATWDDVDRATLCAGTCSSCGADFFGCENTVATICPCCGNAQIVVKRLSGDLKPDYIIPFKLEKQDAVDAMEEFLDGKRLLPNCFTRKNHLEEVRSLYAPFWLFDVSATGCSHFKVSAEEGYGKNKTYYRVECDGDLAFEKLPVCASAKMDEALMDNIEPFGCRDKKDFNTSFLAGYLAEKYDVPAKDCEGRVRARLEGSFGNELREFIPDGYTYEGYDGSGVKIKDCKVKYALFPVWILNTVYKGKPFQFMMNGQSGAIAGKLPVDKAKLCLYLLPFIAAGILMLALLIATDAPGKLFGGGIAVWIVGTAVWINNLYREMDIAKKKTEACDYTVPGSLKFNSVREWGRV